MENQMFDLLEKMYIEMQEMKQNMATKDDLEDMATKDDLENMATKDDLDRTNQFIVRLEDKMDTNHKALFDGYKQTYEKLTDLERKLDEVDLKVERQDVEIKVIRSG